MTLARRTTSLMTASPRPTPLAGAALAVHALPRERSRFETVLADRVTAGFAHAVRAAVHPCEGGIDLFERFHRALGHRQDARLLRGRLSAVREAAFVELRIARLSGRGVN